MAKQLRVLFLSSEVEPFAKTGGLADVAGALPKFIKGLDHEIRVMMPRYGSINERVSRLHDMSRLSDIRIPVGKQEYQGSVQSSFLSNGHGKVQVYFLSNPDLFGRKGMYVHPETGKEFPDNDDRFIFFCRGVLETLKALAWQPDVIHCNDWHTGLVPAYLKTIYKDDPFYKGTKTLFTIHNMAYQGVFPKQSFAKTLLPEEFSNDKGIAQNGSINMLKAGLLFADGINTVSEKYAEEIASSPEFGFGLEDLIKKRKADVGGILNGADYHLWSPEVDPHIPHKYDSGTIEVKKQNTAALRKLMGLTEMENTPVIGIVSRLAEQKGIDLLCDSMDEIMALGVQMVVLGVGPKEFSKPLESAARKYKERIAVDGTFNEPLAHLIEAGSDMFLMPSRYEPCGLNQLYSMRYGTVPIARATGGLEDTIEEFSPEKKTGTGFKFVAFEKRELVKTIQRAVKTYSDPDAWRALMLNGMGKDFSWGESAKKYVQRYRALERR